MMDFTQVRQEFNRQRLGFIHAELDIAFTFAEVARTEQGFGNADRAAHNLELAERARQEAQRRMDECDSECFPAAFDAAQDKMARLLALLESCRNDQD